MDFYRICERTTKSGKVEIYPEFLVGRSRDILIQGRDFQAIWDEEKGLWSTDEFDVATFVPLRAPEESQGSDRDRCENYVQLQHWTMDQLPDLEVQAP